MIHHLTLYKQYKIYLIFYKDLIQTKHNEISILLKHDLLKNLFCCFNILEYYKI